MVEALQCPSCLAQLTLPSLEEGQKAQCPRCRHVFEPLPKRLAAAAPFSGGRAKYQEEADEFAEEDGVLTHRLLRSEPLRGEWKAFVAMGMLVLSIFSYAGQCYLNYERAQLTELELEVLGPGFGRFDFRPPPGPAMPARLAELQRREENVERLEEIAFLVHHATFWPAMIFFLIWLSQASWNLRVLQAEGLSHSAGTAVLSFFIPVINLFRPCVIVQEIWKASDPQATATPRSWLNVPDVLVVRLWWLAYLAYWGLAVGSAVKELERWNDNEQFLAALRMRCGADLCIIAAGVLLIFIIRGIAQRQTQRYIRLYEDPL